MRDPKRIPRLLKKVEKFWKKYPDLRLGQLIINFAYDTDGYFIEDDKLEKRLDKELNKK